MIGIIIRRGKFANFEKKSFVFLLGTQKNRLNETILLRIQTCKKLLSACLFLFIKSRLSSKIKVIMDNVCLNLLCLCGAQWLNRRFASSRLRRQSHCVDTETGIKQKDKKSSRSDWDEKYQSKQTFYPLLCTGSTQVDPSRQDRKIVDLDVKNQVK